MQVRDALQERARAWGRGLEPAGEASLPLYLQADQSVRLGMMQRLAASRAFAVGDKAGVLKTAQRRSGRPFRLDVRQRVVVKALVSRHAGAGAARGGALAKHVAYLERPGAGVEGARPEFFNGTDQGVHAAASTASWANDRHHFRFIVSPEHGDRIADLPSYIREVMRRVGEDLGQPRLTWIAVCHFDTERPHAHVLMRGRRADDKDLVVPRDYVAYGFRARAQEVAHERLGDLSRVEAERRIWRDTQADRFTGFDRRLLQTTDAEGRTEGGGEGAWRALSRGRLRHLEGLGLAQRDGRGYRLDPALEAKLRGLQLRQEVIRALQQPGMDHRSAFYKIDQALLGPGQGLTSQAGDDLSGARRGASLERP